MQNFPDMFPYSLLPIHPWFYPKDKETIPSDRVVGTLNFFYFEHFIIRYDAIFNLF